MELGITPYLSKIYYMVEYRVSDRTTVEVGGHTAVFPSSVADRFSWTLDTEKEVLNDLLSNLEEDDVFYDVGANVGLYTCLAGDVIQGGGILAFEPYGPVFDCLKRHIRLNSVDARAFQVALSDGDRDVANIAGSQTEIETVVGDEFVRNKNIDMPDVIKIDVEGAETNVLRGLHDTLLDEDCRLVYCEIHPELLDQRGESVHDVTEQLRQLGFMVEEVSRRGEEAKQPFLRGRK